MRRSGSAMKRRAIKNLEFGIWNSWHRAWNSWHRAWNSWHRAWNSWHAFQIPNSKFLILTAVFCFGAATSAYAQKYSNVGRAKCVNCHDHDKEKLWSEKKDG